ncbi:hypothetical protein QYE76_058119 [Lolium multiflorum]|uniref:Zinc finger-XS domain-containing protein n=1 Tax=Lolium multiflorum TaxID=4521 RepID=A0AAD8T6G2_LOLMU|nr:hypothetical protein QYE76_058119 [Lolium multiflorum]
MTVEGSLTASVAYAMRPREMSRCRGTSSIDQGFDPNDPGSFTPWVFQKDIDILIEHATGVGKGSQRKHKASSKAKHVAFGKFLRDYVKTGLIPLVGPAVGPHVLH